MKGVMFLYQTNKARSSEPGGGGGGTPYNGLYGKVSPERRHRIHPNKRL